MRGTRHSESVCPGRERCGIVLKGDLVVRGKTTLSTIYGKPCSST